MSVTESRISKMKEFMSHRLEMALLEFSDKHEKVGRKSTVTLHILHEANFNKVISDVEESLQEYLASDFWTEKDIEEVKG